MDAKVSVGVIYVDVTIHLLLYNLHDCTFNLIFYALRKRFQGLTPAQHEIFAKISLYITLKQPDFYYISTICFQDSTPTQLEIFVNGMILHYARTT